MADQTPSLPPVENRVNYFFTANIAISALALMFVLLRLFTKIFILRTFGSDDGMIIMGMACSIVSTVILCIQTKYGLAHHIAHVDPPLLPDFFKIMYAAVLLYIFTCLFVKLSIVLFYRRLSNEKLYTRCVWVLIIFNVLICITMSAPAAFGCQPISFFWDTNIVGGHCIEHQKLYTVNTALNVTMDFAILILPIPLVWKTQMPLKKRLVVIALFALGGFVCIASLIRVTKLFGPTSAQDITWAAVDSHTWSMIEINAGIIAGCVPTFRPLFSSCFGFLKSSTTGNSRPTYGDDYVKNYPGTGSGTGEKRSWRFPSQGVAMSTMASSSPKSITQKHAYMSKSDEELIMGKEANDTNHATDHQIWRTTDFKVDVETASTTVKVKEATGAV